MSILSGKILIKSEKRNVSGNQTTSCKTPYFHKPHSVITFTWRPGSGIAKACFFSLLTSEVVQSCVSMIMKWLCTNFHQVRNVHVTNCKCIWTYFYLEVLSDVTKWQILWLHIYITLQTEGHWLYKWKLTCEPSSVSVKPALKTLRNKFSPYCFLSQPKMVVYMPQISTHKHYSLEGSENAS